MRRRDCTLARYDSTHDTELEAVRDTARGKKGPAVMVQVRFWHVADIDARL